MKPCLILKKSSKDNDLNNKHNANNNTFRETKIMEKLIVVDDVSCLADKLLQFSSYLTVAFIFSMLFTQKKQTGKRFFGRQNFLTILPILLNNPVF